MPRKLFLIGLVIALCFGRVPDCRASGSGRDNLVPVKEALGLSAAYKELWQQKLLVTPGEIARFVGLPGTTGVETTISVYRAPGKEGSLPGDYWMTATQAPERLWNCVAPDAQGQVDPNAITVQRCDAPVAESTALAMQKTWLAMLSQSRPQRNLREIPVDSSREIFSAEDSDGKVLQGESSATPQENTKALVNISLSLLEYCGADVLGRVTIAADIEKAASHLLDRIALPSMSKRRNSKATSSPKVAVTPRKQSISKQDVWQAKLSNAAVIRIRHLNPMVMTYSVVRPQDIRQIWNEETSFSSGSSQFQQLNAIFRTISLAPATEADARSGDFRYWISGLDINGKQCVEVFVDGSIDYVVAGANVLALERQENMRRMLRSLVWEKRAQNQLAGRRQA